MLIKYIEYFRAVANAQGWAFGSKNNEARLTGETQCGLGDGEVKREGTAINSYFYTPNKDFYFKCTLYLLGLT